MFGGGVWQWISMFLSGVGCVGWVCVCGKKDG